MESGKVNIKQVRGLSGSTGRVRDTIKALGLGKVGRKKEITVNPAVWGMLRKVRHLIEVTKA